MSQSKPTPPTEPIETSTGLPARRVSSSSRRMTSEAVALPPGLSTRSTTALTASSSRAWRISAATESPPTLPGGCSPSTMAPWATTTPILSARWGASSRRRAT